MKAILLSLLLLVGLSQVFGQTVTTVNAGVQYNSTVDNCVTQYWRFDASTASAQSYLFITVMDDDIETQHGVAFYVSAGYQPSSSNHTWMCDTVNQAQGFKCYIRIDTCFQPAVYYITTTISWGGNPPTNVSSAYAFTVVLGGVSVTDLGTIGTSGLAASNRATQNYTAPVDPHPWAPEWEHYKVTVSPLPNLVNQGADLVINLTNIQFWPTTAIAPAFQAFLTIGQYNDETNDCLTREPCTQSGSLPGLACSWRKGYCGLVAGTYFIAIKRANVDGNSWFNFTVSAYWDTKTVTPLTLNTAKYDQISDWAMEKYYTFTTTGPADEVTVNVYDVAGGTVTWWASQNYLVVNGASGGNCNTLIGCSTAYPDACRDQYHYCPTPSSGTTTTWYVTVRAMSRIDGVRNRDFISYVIQASAKTRANTALTSPQFAVTGNVFGAVYQEDYDYYSFALPSAIVNETFYIELYVDSTQDEALLSRNYLMDGTTFAGPTLSGSSSRCQDSDWHCRTNQTGATGNQRCYLQIPTCKLIPGSTIYFSVYGIKSQFYGIPISYTLFGGLSTPMQLQDGISYQDQTNQGSYVHYLYRYSATDKTPGDALMIEVTNIKASTRTNVYVNFKGALAGDCPCYKYDYMCQDSQECLFDTYSLFGGAGCQALQTGDIYISVLGVNDTGLPNIGYTITITKYNWAGPVNTLVAGNLVYGYVSDSEYVFYWLDTSTITAASPLVEFEVRFVEYIKNGNNDNEQLTLYAMRDNLLTPTCAPYTCTTPRYTDANGYSYCKVVLQPCQFDKTKDWYLVVKGIGGTNKGRSIHYTVRAKPVAVTPMALTKGVPQPGSVDDIGQIDHYSYTVTSTTNTRLYIEMYVDKDFARQVEFKVNYGYLASGSMCYNYTGSCTVITGYDVKCVYHIPNCQLQAGTYYFGVHALNDFYNGPVPYTIAVYEKSEILSIGDATDPAYGPVFTKLQRGEYQLFQFDTSSLKQGDIWYFEIDQVERGNLTVVASTDKPAGLCPCYGPIGSNVIGGSVTYNVTNYWLFTQSCSKSNLYYFYVQPLLADGYWNESHVAFSATIYVNKPTVATTLVMGQANNVTALTTQYTHRYYVIPMNAAYGQSDIIVHFRTPNSTFPTLYGRMGSYTNQYCTNTQLCNAASCDVVLKPCDHRLDQGSYYFDVTAFTNDSYAFELWYDRVDVSSVAINTNVTFNFSADAAVNNYHLLTPTVPAGALLRITLFGYGAGPTATVLVAVGSRTGAYCSCTATPDSYTLSTTDLVIDWTQCKVGSTAAVNVYVTVMNPAAANQYTLRYNVIAAPTVQALGTGSLGTFSTTGWLANEGDFAVYRVTIPASSTPVYWDVSMDNAGWGTGTTFTIYRTFGSTFAYQSKPPASDVCNSAGTCAQSCSASECCTDATKSNTILFTVYRMSAGNATYTLTANILSKINAYTQTANVTSAQVGIPSGYSVSHINNIPTGSVAVLTVYNTNFTVAPEVFRVDADTTPLIPVGVDGSGCFTTGSTEICSGVWTPGPNATCVTNYDCASPAYTVTYANKDATTNNAYNVLWTVYPPLTLTLGTSLTYNIIPALVNRQVQFVLDLTNAAFDAGNKYISVNVTSVTGPSTITVTYNAGSPSCSGASLCTFTAPNCEGTIDGCPTRSTKYYISIVADNTGSYVISTALITKPVTTLPSGLSSYTNREVDSYYVYPYSTPLSYLDVYYSAMNPATQTNQWGLGDYCTITNPTTVDGTRNRIYPCILNQATNKRVYFRSNGFVGQANYTYTVNSGAYANQVLSIGTQVTGILDKDTTYSFYSLTLPTMKPYDSVTVNFLASCGAIHVLENWNAIAWPDQETPITTGSGTCYRSAVTLSNNPSFTYNWCDWPYPKQERTIYFTVMGAERPFTNLISYSVLATLSNNAPKLTQLPLRQDYFHNSTGNVVYWFETQTEAVGTQVYINVTVPLALAGQSIAAVRNEWFDDANCQNDDQLLYNELSTGAVPSWGDGGNTVCFSDATWTTCTFMLYPAEYRDGRYYVYLNAAAQNQPVHLYAWVQRQGAVNVAQDWSGYGTLGLPKQYQYYAIATSGHNYVTIKLWNVTNGAVSLLLPEYTSGQLTNKFYGGETLGSFEATDANDAFAVNPGQFLVAPLGVCYFCTPYIYVAVRADTITQLGLANSTVGYSISFHFPAEMQINNDTTVCAQTHFNANETTYLRNVTWEDIWVVKSWDYTGEQYFYWDTLATTQNLNFVFSGVGPASKNSPTKGQDECGYSSANAQVTLSDVGTTATYTQECNYNQYHITVLDSQNAVQSSYYLHPVVYQYPVQTYTLGTTISSTKCGSGLKAYYKVALTPDNVQYLNVDYSGSVTRIDFLYGQVPNSGLWTATPCSNNVLAVNSAHYENFCFPKTATLYFTVVAFGPYSFNVNLVAPTTAALTLNTPYHGSIVSSRRTIHTISITPTPGQQLVVTLSKYWANQAARVIVSKDNVRGICTSTWMADTSATDSATVTLSVCDTAAATYYISVEPLTSCSTSNVNEYSLTASLTTAIPVVTLSNGVSVNGASTTTSSNVLYTFTPTAGNFIAVNFRTTDYSSTAATLTLQYSSGNALGNSGETCLWYTANTLCTLDVRPGYGFAHWCTAEIPACSFAAGRMYGFRVVSSDAAAHPFQLTVSQQSFTALSSTATSASVTNAANYYSISTSTIQAIGLKVVVTSGQFEVRVWTYNCTYDCNQFERYFRCDANEGECRLEFANAVSHPRSLVYQVKIYGTGSYSASALTGTANSLSAGSIPSTYFCYGTINYTTWNYKSIADRDAEARRLYNKWTGTGKWNCPSQACLKNLKYLACYYFFPQADSNGFLYDTCQADCWTTTTTCGGNFTWAGFPEWDCYNHFYKPAPYCTGAFPGCDGVPGSGKTYDVCGVCGGNGQSCATTSASGGPSSGISSTTGSTNTTTLTTTGTTSTGTTTAGKNTTTTTTTTSKTTTTTTTSKSTTTTAGPTTTSTTGVNAAFAIQPAFIFVMFAALVLLFLQA